MASPPTWLRTFADTVALLLEPIDRATPVGCHFTCVQGTWEVTLFLEPYEVVGGPQDGARRSANFELDVAALVQLFTRVDGLTWQARPAGPDDHLGGHISLVGEHAGHRVWLRILNRCPQQLPATRTAHLHDLA